MIVSTSSSVLASNSSLLSAPTIHRQTLQVIPTTKNTGSHKIFLCFNGSPAHVWTLPRMRQTTSWRILKAVVSGQARPYTSFLMTVAAKITFAISVHKVLRTKKRHLSARVHCSRHLSNYVVQQQDVIAFDLIHGFKDSFEALRGRLLRRSTQTSYAKTC